MVRALDGESDSALVDRGFDQLEHMSEELWSVQM